MKPTGRSSTALDVVMRARTMMKKRRAVVRMVFCMKRTNSRIGYLFHNRQSVNIHTSLVTKPRNQRRLCLMRDRIVCTASVLQNADVHSWIW
jgi:hypothetical protein